MDIEFNVKEEWKALERIMRDVESQLEHLNLELKMFGMLNNNVKTEESINNNILKLSASCYCFKGKKPVAVIFPDGRRVSVATWKKAAEVILKDCANMPSSCERLIENRDKIMGRKCLILGSSPKGMNTPLEIGNALFMEAQFDTKTLIYVLTQRILKPTGYDYGKILIELSV